MPATAARSGLFVGVVTGGILTMLGLVGLILSPSPEVVIDEELWERHADGTVTVYDHVETGGQWYEFEPIDESTTAVVAVSEYPDVRVEVYRGPTSGAERFLRRGTDEVAFSFDLVTADGAPEAAHLMDEGRDVYVEVYRGADAREWFYSQALEVVFEGTEAEALAGVEADAVEGTLFLGSWVMVAVGFVVVAAALTLVWGSAPRRVVFGIVGAGAGALPTAFVFALLDASAIDGDWALVLGSLALMWLPVGIIGGAIAGAMVCGGSGRSAAGSPVPM